MHKFPAVRLGTAVEDIAAEHAVARRTVAEGTAAGHTAADSLHSCVVE